VSERLSEEELAALEWHGCSSGTGTAPVLRSAIIRAVTELRARRAADLTVAEREALVLVPPALEAMYRRECIDAAINGEPAPKRARLDLALAALARVLGGGE
jgi:hypothetical protein